MRKIVPKLAMNACKRHLAFTGIDVPSGEMRSTKAVIEVNTCTG